MSFRHAAIVATLFAFAGCTTQQTLSDSTPTPASIAQEVKAGDQVHVVADSGLAYDIEVMQVEPAALFGKNHDGALFRIQFAAIRSITVQHEEVSAWKTLGGIVSACAMVAGFLITVVGQGLAALGSAVP